MLQTKVVWYEGIHMIPNELCRGCHRFQKISKATCFLNGT